VFPQAECGDAPPVHPRPLADTPHQPGGVQQGAGTEALPSLQLQGLAQPVGHDVGGVGNGHHRAGEPERLQLLRQGFQQLHRTAQQVQPGLSGEPGLPDGHHHQSGAAAFSVSPRPDCDRIVHKADAVGYVQGLGSGLLREQIHQNDLLTVPGGG
jgi:hypothetical protein